MTTAAQSIPTLGGGLPLIGHLPQFRKNRLALFQRVYRELGEMGRLRVAQRQVLVATSPELAQAILLKSPPGFRKFAALARHARPMIGNGLLSSEGDFWKRQRRLIAPGLKRRRIASYVDTMTRHADEAVVGWKERGHIDVVPDMTRLTMAIASEAMFSTPSERYANTASTAVHAALEHIASSLGRPITLPYSWPTPRNLRLRRAIAPFEAIVYDIIRERREGERPDDILSMLLDAQDEDDGTGMTDQQVRDEVMTLFVAGHETTSLALTWSAYLLARHPEVAERLAEECRDVLGGRPPTFDDLDRLPYAKQVFLESMRLYPPAYILGRQATEPTTLLDWDVPNGAMVVLNIYGLHHRSDLFEDADRFDPDRFEGDREKALPRGAYVPFADGARVCIGGHFAVMEGHVVLAHLAQNLKLAPYDGPSLEPVPRVTLRPHQPFTLKVSVR